MKPVNYSVNFGKIWEMLHPPLLRRNKTLAWGRSLLAPVQSLYDYIFGMYATGSSDPLWTEGTYTVGERVTYINKAVYECIQAHTTSSPDILPTNTSYWKKVSDIFIGARERIKYNSQVVLFEYALNKYFQTTGIYIENTTKYNNSFILGQTSTFSSNLVEDSTFVNRTSYIARTFIPPISEDFTIWVPGDSELTLESVNSYATPFVLAGITFRAKYTDLHPLVQDWVDSLVVYPSSNVVIAVNNLINGLDDDGVLANLDLFHVLAGLDNIEQAMSPIFSTSGKKFVNYGTGFDKNGVNGDGSFTYIDLQWNPNTDATEYALNNNAFGVYIIDRDSVVASNRIDMGNNADVLGAPDGSVFSLTNGGITSGFSDSIGGLFIARRTSGTSSQIWKNGSSTGASIITNSTSTVDNLSYFLGGTNTFGTPGNFTTGKYGAVVVGSSSVNQTLLYNRLATYFSERGVVTI